MLRVFSADDAVVTVDVSSSFHLTNDAVRLLVVLFTITEYRFVCVCFFSFTISNSIIFNGSHLFFCEIIFEKDGGKYPK